MRFQNNGTFNHMLFIRVKDRQFTTLSEGPQTGHEKAMPSES